MYTILLDSSNTKLAVGIAKNGIVLKSIIYEAWQEQSEHMIPELNNILETFDVKREEIDSVMVAIGPGSYTGVRIAITIAKTMGYVLHIPVYPVSSLHVLKCENKPSICIVNARSKRSYVGVYQGKNTILVVVYHSILIRAVHLNQLKFDHFAIMVKYYEVYMLLFRIYNLLVLVYLTILQLKLPQKKNF